VRMREDAMRSCTEEECGDESGQKQSAFHGWE
jgi:hypothetical protein